MSSAAAGANPQRCSGRAFRRGPGFGASRTSCFAAPFRVEPTPRNHKNSDLAAKKRKMRKK